MEAKKLFTLGIEEEFQIVDPESRELKAHIHQMLKDKDSHNALKDVVKKEMHQSVVEVGTKVCCDIKEAKNEVINLRTQLANWAKEYGLRIAAAGTHPFSHWMDQPITDDPRYHTIVEDMQMIARANLIFGLHVHVGIDDRETAIHILNAARYFLPHVLAFSTNSPFWVGRNTGFKSYRIKVFDRFPRTGIPDYFNSVSEYDNFIKLLVKTNCIDNGKKIWWDIRLHPHFDTLEFRICDVPMRVDESIAIAAMFQAVVAKLHKLIKQNLGFRLYRRALIMENRFRASRYGIQGKLIDFGKQEEVPVVNLLDELVEFVDDVVDNLNCREEVHYFYEIKKMGSGADRQLEVWEKTKDFRKVVDYIIEETHRGLPG
jgi:carboxylate-amine ligase